MNGQKTVAVPLVAGVGCTVVLHEAPANQAKKGGTWNALIMYDGRTLRDNAQVILDRTFIR